MTAQTRVQLSSFCRFQEHARCQRARAKCGCKCHGKTRLQEVPAAEPEAPHPNPIQRSPMANLEAAEMPPPTSDAKVEPVVELVKEEPPAKRGPESLAERYGKELETVKADPGEWYRLLNCNGDSKAAASLRSGLVRQVEGFEFVSRRGCVWARFVGEGKAS